MPNKVSLVITVEFETRDEGSARASIQRIPGDLQYSIQEGKLGHAMTGVIPRSVRIEIAKQSVS